MVVTLPRLDPERVRELARSIVASGASARSTAGERLQAAADALGRWFVALPLLARAVLVGTLLVIAASALRAVLFRRERSSWQPPAPRAGREIAVTLALAVLLCGAAWFAAGRGEQLPTGSGSILHAGSTLDATARGVSALPVLLRRLGTRARPLWRPWPPPRGVRVLVVLSPEEPPDAEELAALTSWVERGGTVVLGLGSGPFGVTFGLDDAFGLSLREVEVYGRVRARVDALDVEMPAGRVLGGAGAEPIVASERGPLCARLQRGDGEVVACAGSYAFSNDGLLAADDAVFVARLLVDAAQGGIVGFDEFHHGAGTRVDAVELFAQSPIGWGLIQLGVAATLFAYASSRRVGASLREADYGAERREAGL